ncbi:MAG: hypothetical protein ACLQGV_17925 [Bryobacteraceae bacterium]
MRWSALLAGALLPLAVAFAQAPAGSAAGVRPDWRHIGNSAVEMALASPASGAADRVWFSPDGALLFVRTAAGRVFQTADFENWQPTAAAPPNVPEGGQPIRSNLLNPQRLYSFGQNVLRSDDGGGSWSNVTAYGRTSIIGPGMRDLAVSPRNADDLVVADDLGVWRSLDGGLTWAGLNDALPNLPARKLTALPQGSRGLRLLADGLGLIEWAPGEKQAWRTVSDQAGSADSDAQRAVSETLGVEVTALVAAGDLEYAGSVDGRLWTSLDKGGTWNAPAAVERGPVESIWVDPKDPRTALAALGGAKGPRVLRTVNAGQFWDDLTAELPEGPAHGVAADRPTGTVYVATDRGVFFTHEDLNAAAPPANWTALVGLPEAPALDLRLDGDGNQLFVALQGYGVYAALAPHRWGNLRLVNAADFSPRPAAPGSLLSVLGGRVVAARAGSLEFPVLAATDTETQIQVPFTVPGGSVSVALDTGQGSYRLALPVENVSPAVFIDRDGSPLVLNADSGVLMDAMNPAHSNGRLQILATGLGRVRPDWPAGMAGPAEEPPQVVAPVNAYLDRTPLEVSRAVLAPGYIGLYLVEVQLPALVNAGPAELYLESEAHESNRVRVWLEP